LLNGTPPLIYEDGEQRRDFVCVGDVVQACRLGMEVPEAAGQVFNIGSGRSYTVRTIAGRLATMLGKAHIQPVITGRYRVGDVRHCFADITLARKVLGYEPQVTLDDGLQQFAACVESQMSVDSYAQAYAELEARGLTR
jgi:dTDP-L-rhamnose 4-epimerase